MLTIRVLGFQTCRAFLFQERLSAGSVGMEIGGAKAPNWRYPPCRGCLPSQPDFYRAESCGPGLTFKQVRISDTSSRKTKIKTISEI